MFHTQMNTIFALLVLVSSSVAFADIVIRPPGLNDGDQYRLVFVTSGTRDAQSSNIADYNSFVTAQAATSVDLVSLNTSWNAIGSTSTADARDNTGTNPLAVGVPIYRLDGTLVAANNASFWGGSLAAPIRFNQSGGQESASVFTGTGPDGTSNGIFQLGTADAQQLVYVGDPDSVGSPWTALAWSSPGANRGFYAMSGVITVTAVPEPSSFILLGVSVHEAAGDFPAGEAEPCPPDPTATRVTPSLTS